MLARMLSRMLSQLGRIVPVITAALATLVFLSSRAAADGLIVIPNPPVVVAHHFTFAPLEVAYHKVETTIDDQVAVTSVDQDFINPNSMRLEGDYIFPVPADAQINKFEMEIDGKMVQAELLSADKAKSLYEEIVRKAKDPALLEYAGRSLFRVHIFPIEPNSHKRIQLKYTELLKSDHNLLDYHYTLNTEKYSSKLIKTVSLKITVNSAEPLTTLYSPTHDVEVKRTGENKAVVGYEGKDVRPDTDFHLYIGHKASAVGMSLLTYKPDADHDGYFVMLAAPTLSKDVKAMPKDVMFVMDTSGSMSDDHKIEQARKALKFCVDSLNPDDRFEIVRFSTEAEPFFKQLSPANDDNRKKADDYIATLRASGGTAIHDALNAALAERDKPSGRMFLLVFITDGQPTVGEQNPDKILDAVKANPNADKVRIFSFGVGHDVNTKLLDLLGDQTRGYAQYVLPGEDIEIAMSNFFSKVQDPVLAGLKFDTGSISIAKQYPKDLPDLFKGDQLVVFGTYSKGGPAAITLTGTANGKDEKFAQDVKFDEYSNSNNEWIAKLWATRRIGYLLDEIRLHGESKELKDEVTDLARKFGIVTPYTAMLIIEDEKHHGLPVSMHTLGDMERDADSLRRSGTSYSSLAAKDDSGEQAVSNSVNGSLYKNAKSLDGVAQAAEQNDRRSQVTGSGQVLARGPAAPNAPLGGTGGGGDSWTGGTVIAGGKLDLGNGAQVDQAKSGYRVVTNYAQQNRMVNGQAFYLNGSQWMDTRVQAAGEKAKHVKVTFNSDDYFKLLKDHPEAAPWMALGNNVTFTIAGVVYDVVPEEAPKETTK